MALYDDSQAGWKSFWCRTIFAKSSKTSSSSTSIFQSNFVPNHPAHSPFHPPVSREKQKARQPRLPPSLLNFPPSPRVQIISISTLHPSPNSTSTQHERQAERKPSQASKCIHIHRPEDPCWGDLFSMGWNVLCCTVLYFSKSLIPRSDQQWIVSSLLPSSATSTAASSSCRPSHSFACRPIDPWTSRPAAIRPGASVQCQVTHLFPSGVDV
jgi:hypothetical protein